MLIAVKTKFISCNQSYDIGDMAKEFYIQEKGNELFYDDLLQRTGSVMRDGKGDIINELSRGSVCGEYSSILFKKRKLTIECDTWSEVRTVFVLWYLLSYVIFHTVLLH